MLDRQCIDDHRLHNSLPRYGEPQPLAAVTYCLAVTQSAEACAPFVSRLGQWRILYAQGDGFPEDLRQWLAAARVGSHLYIMGDEAFIWHVHSQARDAGLQDDEIEMTLCSVSGARSVYCVHCGLTQPGDAAASLQCRGCDVLLEIREHFSRRLGAYLGVCMDADAPYGKSRS
ncbi:hypothetical protein CFII64_12438 [Pseudomonas sp. CFII64]|uniref:dimethylamine monooxygenase subunit DmmA family protein n=1 Tax=Pseudomonas sp. CFII64 TaxID=911242 RepID=UPI0003581D2F|nr:dimethylamine monooxygenase subunit DmmA family protein [Pseudomonas sp. CFII64]EPJ84991.1 hypothetical protein CFII64_12438 [Pseudomonas sp. CFII64]